MRELGLTGLSEDGRFLVAHDSLTDESFLIPTDTRLTSLLDTSPAGEAKHPDVEPGPRESSMEVTLSPRDIQTRIRRGESPEQVAEESGMPVEKVRGFAVPVIAEREFIVEQARKTTVRQMRSSGGAGQLLGALVDESVASGGSAPESAAWDSWRREDGRWTVVVSTDVVPAPATFLFDVKGRYVLPSDDAALELIGDFMRQETPDMAIANAVRETSAAATPGVDTELTPTLELETAVAELEASGAEAERDENPVEDELKDSIVEELIEELNDVDVTETSAPVSSLKEARERRALEQLAATVDAEAAPSEVSDVEITEEHDLAVPDVAHPSKRKHERRRVPSWDEIMFGGNHD